MSSLACSLLALTALLTTAHALLPNPYCSYLDLGKKDGYPTDNYVEFTLNTSGGSINIPDKCSRPGNKIVGEAISVCNTPYSKPEIIQVMQSEYKFKPNFALYYIDCPSDIPGCNSLKVEITQYCKMVTAPH